MNPPLQLEQCFFPEVTVKAVAGFQADTPPDQVQVRLTVTPEVRHDRDDALLWLVNLRIVLEPSEPGRFPYQIDLLAVGLFLLDPGVPEPERQRLVAINGCSMVYGAAREFLLTVTGRGPWGACQLPTHSFFTPPTPQAPSARPQAQLRRKGGKPKASA
ncbi:MAG: hypothetical protein ACYDA8_01200 [Deferrisomatales bacterium]